MKKKSFILEIGIKVRVIFVDSSATKSYNNNNTYNGDDDDYLIFYKR